MIVCRFLLNFFFFFISSFLLQELQECSLISIIFFSHNKTDTDSYLIYLTSYNEGYVTPVVLYQKCIFFVVFETKKKYDVFAHAIWHAIQSNMWTRTKLDYPKLKKFLWIKLLKCLHRRWVFACLLLLFSLKYYFC